MNKWNYFYIKNFYIYELTISCCQEKALRLFEIFLIVIFDSYLFFACTLQLKVEIIIQCTSTFDYITTIDLTSIKVFCNFYCLRNSKRHTIDLRDLHGPYRPSKDLINDLVIYRNTCKYFMVGLREHSRRMSLRQNNRLNWFRLL